MFEISKLIHAEKEIQNLLNQNETNWKDVAKKCNRQPFLIWSWRYIKAAEYYMQTIGSDDVEEVDKAKRPLHQKH